MNKIGLVFICFIVLNLYSYQVMAQTSQNEEIEDEGIISRIIYNDNVAIKINYFGELVLHPGLTIGTDYTLNRKNWVTVHWDTEIGGFRHKWNNTSLFLKSSVGARLPLASLFVDFNVGAGYMHSFPAGKIYRRASNGTLEKAPNLGSSHFMPNFSLLFGFDGTRKKDLPFTIHAGVEAYLQSSFNHIFLPHAAAKIGMTYKFKK